VNSVHVAELFTVKAESYVSKPSAKELQVELKYMRVIYSRFVLCRE